MPHSSLPCTSFRTADSGRSASRAGSKEEASGIKKFSSSSTPESKESANSKAQMSQTAEDGWWREGRLRQCPLVGEVSAPPATEKVHSRLDAQRTNRKRQPLLGLQDPGPPVRSLRTPNINVAGLHQSGTSTGSPRKTSRHERTCNCRPAGMCPGKTGNKSGGRPP